TRFSRDWSSDVCSSDLAQWSRSYSYGHFGNRWIGGFTGHTLHSATPTSSAAIEATTNRLASTTGAVYDNAGNMTAHPLITPGGRSEERRVGKACRARGV